MATPVDEIRRLAVDEGMTRTQIAQRLGIPYARVQRALQGFHDIPREPNRGGAPFGTGSPTIEFEGETMPRTEAARILSERGRSVSEIAKELDAPYQAIYTALRRKGKVHVTRERPYVELDGEIMLRADAVRNLYQRGLTRSEIAEKLGISYQAVYNNTRRRGWEYE